MKAQQIVRISEYQAVKHEMYAFTPEGIKIEAPFGVLDTRLGTSSKKGTCTTCHLQLTDCVGHYAYIELPLPIYHIGYFRHCIKMLQNICKKCSCVMLDFPLRRKYLGIFRRPGLDNMTRQARAKEVNNLCRAVRRCPSCDSINGVVKKSGPLKISHEPFRNWKGEEEIEEYKRGFQGILREQPELAPFIGKPIIDITAQMCLELFNGMSDEDVELLGMNPSVARPEDYLWQYISVPPTCIRPTVQQEDSSNEDDLSIKLSEIIYCCGLIEASLQLGQGIATIMEQWEFLTLSVAMYVDSSTPTGSALINTKPIRGFCQRLKGKQGRFRGNLSGKRVDFSGRTVIGPDPNLDIDQVAVPIKVAKKLTFPERVTDHNIDRLRKAILNGTNVHPGANYVFDKERGFKRALKFADVTEVAKHLKIGDTVERHLHDGDAVLFNRQPSLHRLSIMCHRAKIRPWQTFRLNECACTPYNADFDGDEMNLHVPQTEESRTEALELMSVRRNLVTPKNGEPIIAATQDFITAAYLLSLKDRFLDRAQFCQVCSYFDDANLEIEIPPPVIQKPVRLWTGKQVFNILMRPNSKSPILVNLEAKCKTMQKPDPADQFLDDMAPNDGYLVIRNSEIMTGVFDKATVGDGKKNSVFGVIQRDFGSTAAAVAMNRLAKVSARWLANIGFSIGIADVTPSASLVAAKESMVEAAYAECGGFIQQAKDGNLENLPGSTQEGTLETMVSGTLTEVRGAVGDICMKQLSRHNAPLIMATCGSKGSVINVAQMVALVGQQIIGGKRVANGFDDRTLPHFEKKNRMPAAKGFVRNSFFSGLAPYEFLFHAISGREGLVDTAVKTAETGYMARRLMKALEDLCAHYDYTVRNSVGGIVQFQYGDDRLDPAELEGDAVPVAFPRTWSHALATGGNKGDALLPYEVRALAESITESEHWSSVSIAMRKGTLEFLESYVVQSLAALREKLYMFRADDARDADIGREEIMDRDDEDAVKWYSNALKVTPAHVEAFLEQCREKYLRAQIEPGSTVGAVAGQSIGEPGTQMTLKTFHFAGVASMNVTMGVPRIKEVINAVTDITTPIITTTLDQPKSDIAARIVKGRIERTTLGDIASVIEEAWDSIAVFIGIHIDYEAIRRLQLELTLDDIKWAIVAAPKLGIKAGNVTVIGSKNRLRIYIDDEDKFGKLKALKRVLPSVVVKGLPPIIRGIIRVDEKTDERQLLCEGHALLEVMNTHGVMGTRTKSNDIMETAHVLGIEAARQTIYTEIQTVMKLYGLNIDPRHVYLLADQMTCKGQILGITRFGIQKSKDSVLMNSSFERSTDHLFDASLYGKSDAIDGVSECIIMGTPAKKAGTMLPVLVREPPLLRAPKPLLFEDTWKTVQSRSMQLAY